MSSQSMPIWHMCCFGLRQLEPSQLRKGIFLNLSLNYRKEFREREPVPVWSGKYLFTTHVLSPPSSGLYCSLLKSRPPTCFSLAQVGT